MTPLHEVTANKWQGWYRALRAVEPDAYRKAISYAEGVTLQHNLSDKLAADIEVACVMLACELLDVKP